MALQAVSVPTEVTQAPVAPSTFATITPIATRAMTQLARRHERRRWFAVGAVLFGAPVLTCLGILGVVR